MYKFSFLSLLLVLPLSFIIGNGKTSSYNHLLFSNRTIGDNQTKSTIKVPKSINWFNGTQDAFQDSATRWKKPSFIYIFIDTWDACKGFENNVLTDTNVANFVDSNFVTFKINMEFNPNEAMKFMIDEVPAVILFDKSGKEIDRLQGYHGIAEFRKFLKKAVK